MKNVRVATLTTDIKGFFRDWLKITGPFHKLSKKEQDVLGLLLYHHHILRKDISNDEILWKIVFDYDTKIKIKEELGIKDTALQNLLTSLRKRGAIHSNKIVPNFVPILTEDVNNYKIVFNINIIDDK